MASPGKIVLWWEPKSQTGREKEERKDLLHNCRVRWVCQEQRGKTENTQLIDLCTFAYWFLNIFLAQFDSFKLICVTKVSLSCVFIMTSHHIPDNRRVVLIKKKGYIFECELHKQLWGLFCPGFCLTGGRLPIIECTTFTVHHFIWVSGFWREEYLLTPKSWFEYGFERQYYWCQRMDPSCPRPKQYHWYKNINDIKSTLEYTEETKKLYSSRFIATFVFFIYLCPPLTSENQTL